MDHAPQGIPVPLCPFCHAPYILEQQVRIALQGNEETLHITCAACARAVVFVVSRSPHRLRSAGVFTDCSAHDYARFWKGHRVTLDDVLAVHQHLRQ